MQFQQWTSRVRLIHINQQKQQVGILFIKMSRHCPFLGNTLWYEYWLYALLSIFFHLTFVLRDINVTLSFPTGDDRCKHLYKEKCAIDSICEDKQQVTRIQ